MNTLQAGYARVNITPMLGIGVRGYFIRRVAKGILDELEASALALSCGDTPNLLVSIDHCGIEADFCNRFRTAMSKAAGIPFENILLTATHTHTGPMIRPIDRYVVDNDLLATYADFLESRLCDLAVLAIADMKPARVGFAVGHAPDRIAYIRRYRMKDGSTFTCPPINDPNIDHPLGELDQRVNVLRFDRQGADSVVILNYGVHADTVNGELISADWPGWTRKTIETALDGVKCLCIIGAEGDVGSTHVFPSGGDMNDTEISFDNEMKSPGMARFVGRALAGTILQVYDKVEYIDVDNVSMLHQVVTVPAKKPDPAAMPLAREYKRLHDEGRDDLIPYTGMQLTTALAEALRLCRMENSPDSFDLELTGLRIGNLVFIGVPGEPFTEIGVQIKKNEGWNLILPCIMANGCEGYYPTKSAFEDGGYETNSSIYAAGVGEAIIDGASKLLNNLKNNN